MLDFICNHLQPSATICHHLLLVADEMLAATRFWGTRRPLSQLAATRSWGRGVPSPSVWLQMRCYLQPYLQPYKVLSINILWRYFGLGCRWQMKMKTIF